MRMAKSQLKQIIKEELKKLTSLEKGEQEEKSDAELACEREAAKSGEPLVFNPSTGKCEMLNEDKWTQNPVQEELKKLSEDDWPKKVKKGRFTKYCKGAGFEGGAGIGCSEKAMDSKKASVRGMASFYMNTVKPGGKDASDVAEELTKESLQEYIDEVLGLSEVTAGV